MDAESVQEKGHCGWRVGQGRRERTPEAWQKDLGGGEGGTL